MTSNRSVLCAILSVLRNLFATIVGIVAGGIVAIVLVVGPLDAFSYKEWSRYSDRVSKKLAQLVWKSTGLALFVSALLKQPGKSKTTIKLQIRNLNPDGAMHRAIISVGPACRAGLSP